MAFCNLFILVLLSVDWLEDPYYGESPFSCAMASTPCNAHQETEIQDMVSVERFLLSDLPDLMPPTWILPLETSATVVLLLPSCIPSMHAFMSLQE